jgi:phosphoglucosamine mutase
MADKKQSLAELKQGMDKMPQTMINVKIAERCDPMQNDDIVAAVRAVENELAGTGRVLLRASGTEPLIRVMIEGEDANQVQTLTEQLADKVKDKLT